ncbi:peptidoglycan-binding domain-containing protein [Patulibacter defluvii]|uniref:peptidoglycan-binding domain-containing protein n=1 Tax=Patulibacter defluvii TaxID=3095358 RepID=UPI002A7640C1|nr:peptidoglycan-binding domain-containing protein [Patulibacter sp. DM4]
MTALTARPLQLLPQPDRDLPRRDRGLAAGLRRAAAVLWAADEASDVVPVGQAVDVQRMLVAVGLLDPAAVSGRWDRPTAAAVAAFQRINELPDDGVAGARTVDLLLTRTAGRPAAAPPLRLAA